MTRQQDNIPLKNQDTYVYIDASNIRWGCQKTLGFRIDFVRLLDYFKQKYPNLKEVRYYEGIAIDDEDKRKAFDDLEREGYLVCPLERKAYRAVEVTEKKVKCPKCGHKWGTKFRRERKTLKSNVDVYLATELLTVAHHTNSPTHIILVSCDGDYAEMIRNALENENVSISVLATPPAKDFKKNTLSIRLRELRKEVPPRYQLTSIVGIADMVKQ